MMLNLIKVKFLEGEAREFGGEASPCPRQWMKSCSPCDLYDLALIFFIRLSSYRKLYSKLQLQLLMNDWLHISTMNFFHGMNCITINLSPSLLVYRAVHNILTVRY